VPGVSSSVGAGAGTGLFGMVLATSHGFSGTYERSGFSRSVSVIAGEGVKMERDYDFDSRVFFADLDEAEAIGRRAGERAAARVHPRKVKTGSNVTVVFDPRAARGLIGHWFQRSMALGGPQDQFSQGHDGQEGRNRRPDACRRSLCPPRVCLPSFDGEGVSVGPLTMVEDGVLQQWYLTTGVARELGLTSNGRAGRGGGVSPSSTNVIVTPGQQSPEDLIASVGTGFYVTELIGQGVNPVTGEYSRGASGFWIENGKLSFAVSEVTIASNLKDMFKRMTLANDIDPKFSIAAPTIAVEGMTLAGE
jgi:PmbA protein